MPQVGRLKTSLFSVFFLLISLFRSLESAYQIDGEFFVDGAEDAQAWLQLEARPEEL